MHMLLEPEVGYTLDGEYSVTCVDAKVACYILCMRWIRGGSIGRSVGGGKMWGVYWVCERGLCGWVFVKGVLLGYFDGFFWGRPMDVNSVSQMGFPS